MNIHSRRRRAIQLVGAALAALAGAAAVALAGPPAGAIGAGEIEALRDELRAAGELTSNVRMRRAYKGIHREGAALVEDAGAAPARFEVLGIMLQGQKRLLALDNSASNRADLFTICTQLAAAPDAFAELRLEADLLLSERDLSAAGADLDARAAALRELIARYRGTPAEAKCLMIASQIAPKLQAFDLEIDILRAMQDRFADHPGVIEFRRKSLAAGRIEALFRGTFECFDGRQLTFPIDRAGHPFLAVFWSRETPGFDVALRQIAAHDDEFPGHFDYFSFNLDELPDAGAGTLRELGLDWTPVLLPGGRASQTFRTYGQREPVSVLVNAYGYTLLTPTNNYGRGHGGNVKPYQIDPVRITDARYLAQLQSLFIGDFLVTREPGARAAGDPRLGAALRETDGCFPLPPFRYRLTPDEALANYRRAARLCADALDGAAAESPDAHRLRARLVVALLGMWKLEAQPAHLADAAAHAREIAAAGPPPDAAAAARFCLAKLAMRENPAAGPDAVTDMVAELGGDEAPAGALAAAAVLALDANDRELHGRLRARLLAHPEAGAPEHWAVTTFLRDRYHTLDLLKVKLSRGERRMRSRYGDDVSPRAHAINHGLDPMTETFPTIELESLDGTPLVLPAATRGKLTLVLFVEPPARAGDPLPLEVAGERRPDGKPGRPGVVQFALEMAERHVHGEVEVVVALLTDDTARARALFDEHQWPCRPAVVPGGLSNPLVRQLGILSADRIPNVFLLRRDGTVAWHTSGFSYKSDFGYPFAIRLAMKVHIEVCDSELALAALADGRFADAQRIFSGPFLPEKDERYRWRAPRFHGRALARARLGEWAGALEDIDTAIAAHRDEFDHPEDSPCQSLLDMHRARATFLERLGRDAEAQAANDAASATAGDYPHTIYDEFHRRLTELPRQ